MAGYIQTSKRHGFIELLLVLVGLGLTSYGAWLLCPPAGFIVPGSILLMVGLFA